MTGILSRYVLRQHLAPAAAGLAIFYFVLSMDFIVDYLSLFITKGVPGLAVLEAFGLSLAWMTLLAVPMAVMVAVLTAFGRLSGDNEITAAKATGVNVFTLMFPVIVVALLVSFGLFHFGNRLLPAANHRLKTLLVDIHKIRPLAALEPGVLMELPGGYSIILDEMDSETSRIAGVRIHKIEGGEPLQTIVASTGEILSLVDEGVLQLRLYDGEIHETDLDDPTRFNRLLFDRHVINIEQTGGELVRSDRTKRGDRELTLRQIREQMELYNSESLAARERIAKMLGSDPASELSGAAALEALRARSETDVEELDTLRKVERELSTLEGNDRRARRLEVEYHKKFSIPFSCVIFVLLGAPLGIRSRRGGVGIGAGIGILVFLVYYLFLIGGEQLGDRGLVSPFWAMWAPNFLFGGLGTFLTLTTVREWRIRPVTAVLDFVLRVPARSPGEAKS